MVDMPSFSFRFPDRLPVVIDALQSSQRRCQRLAIVACGAGLVCSMSLLMGGVANSLTAGVDTHDWAISTDQGSLSGGHANTRGRVDAIAGTPGVKRAEPLLPLACSAQADSKVSAGRLFDFSDSEDAWISVNDGVMGGVSAGRVGRKDGILTFSGRVSLKNNGGFASMRSSGAVPLFDAKAQAFVLRAQGDGVTYQFTVDTDQGWFWAATTPKKGEWTTVRIPFSALQPVSRFGQPVKRAAFDGSQKISIIGVLIGNKRAEKFLLRLDWVEATS
jgi:NADH dehydrogenase [ubiquinone] 1 alpha subcomplex assembly factor 1